jgi:hypothetical protein
MCKQIQIRKEGNVEMLKKIMVGTLLAGLIGILVFGALNRTLDKTGKVAEAQGPGAGRGRTLDESNGQLSNGQGRNLDQVNGQGGNGRGAAGERQYSNYQVAPETWETHEGTVVQVPEAGVELVIETSAGEELVVGTGPLDLASQGFALQIGEPVQVRGYWEAGEFKATQLTRLTNGQTFALRDDSGRPVWAGAGRNAQGSDQSDQGGYSGEGREDALGDGSGTGQAQVDTWLQIQGTVVSVDADILIVRTADGTQVSVENRSWWFAQEQGFSAQIGDEITLTGFYEDEAFEVGRIDDATTGQTVLLRDEDGRPMWAGRGRRGA